MGLWKKHMILFMRTSWSWIGWKLFDSGKRGEMTKVTSAEKRGGCFWRDRARGKLNSVVDGVVLQLPKYPSIITTEGGRANCLKSRERESREVVPLAVSQMQAQLLVRVGGLHILIGLLIGPNTYPPPLLLCYYY